jgi:hemerythrin-like domain-containing protein
MLRDLGQSSTVSEVLQSFIQYLHSLQLLIYWPPPCFYLIAQSKEWRDSVKQKRNTQAIPEIYDLNVIDLILIDHNLIKSCVETLVSSEAEKSKKMSVARTFLNAMSIHSSVEKKVIYLPLKELPEIHSNILAAEVEHGMIDQKVKSLKIKLSRTRLLKDEVEAELKVLADLVRKHLMEEESVTLPLIQESLSIERFKELGRNYMKVRKFTADEIKDYPQLQDDLIQWKDSIQKVSNEFLVKMDKFMENLQH